jgi:hypothetical protein
MFVWPSNFQWRRKSVMSSMFASKPQVKWLIILLFSCMHAFPTRGALITHQAHCSSARVR